MTGLATQRPVRSWPLFLLAAPAFVAVWSGWVGLGSLTGFGVVHPLPGTPLAGWTLDTAITLPVGVEAYAAYALRVWLSGSVPAVARRFAKWSAIGSLTLGAAGQVAYHLMSAAGIVAAPWPITATVACLPVAVLGMGAGLAHLIHATPAPVPVVEVLAANAGTPADAKAGRSTDSGRTVPGQALAGKPASDPARVRPATRTASGRSAAGTVARLVARRPDIGAAEIARRLNVSERTARRHLAAHRTAGQDARDERAA